MRSWIRRISDGVISLPKDSCIRQLRPPFIRWRVDGDSIVGCPSQENRGIFSILFSDGVRVRIPSSILRESGLPEDGWIIVEEDEGCCLRIRPLRIEKVIL